MYGAIKDVSIILWTLYVWIPIPMSCTVSNVVFSKKIQIRDYCIPFEPTSIIYWYNHNFVSKKYVPWKFLSTENRKRVSPTETLSHPPTNRSIPSLIQAILFFFSMPFNICIVYLYTIYLSVFVIKCQIIRWHLFENKNKWKMNEKRTGAALIIYIYLKININLLSRLRVLYCSCKKFTMLDKTTTILFISLELHNSYLFIPIHYGTSSVRDNIYDIIKMHDRYGR